MSDRSDVILVYDGSFEGLMCCVFRCYEDKIFPYEIATFDMEQTVLGETIEIQTEITKSQRVECAIIKKLGKSIHNFLKISFLSCNSEKDMLILKFLILGFRYGKQVRYMLADDTVNKLMKIHRHTSEEAHLLLGFTRFSQHGGVLVSVIEPKNFVLPIIAHHFCDRMKNELFIIYDKNHHYALFHDLKNAEIIPLADFELSAPDPEEERFCELWRTFFNTIAIRERYNPTCQRTHLPLRYRGNMTEFLRSSKNTSNQTEINKISENNNSDANSDNFNSHFIPTF